MGKLEQCLQELGYAVVPIQGSSMWPLLHEKESWVQVTARDDAHLRTGEVVLYRRANGQLVLHRIIRLGENDTYWVCGDHQWKLDEQIPDAQILAVARVFSRNGRCFDEQNIWYRLYGILWNSSMTVRRCCLAFLRLTGVEKHSLHEKK